MRALIQRVKRCAVTTNEGRKTEIGAGLLIFLGVTHTDSRQDADTLATRCAALRIFDDENGKMNLAVRDVNGEVMVVSQFTLYADTRRGNRPGFSDAAEPGVAEGLYERFVASLRTSLAPLKVATGTFRAMMNVELVNDGPVTLLLESRKESPSDQVS